MKILKIILPFCLILCFAIGFYIGKFKSKNFFVKEFIWSIGIYEGDSPLNLKAPEGIKNPVIKASSIKDLDALFVADPFMIKKDSNWYMFFEVLNKKDRKGDIGLAVSKDTYLWNYEGIVLDEPFHLSYPYVFEFKNEYYIVPETHEAYSVRLYKADDFPKKWSFVKNLLIGEHYVDPSIFYYDNTWWLFTSVRDSDILHLFYSEQGLEGPYIKHPKSPIVLGDKNIARPGGRVVILKDYIIRYAQDVYPDYANQVVAFKIKKLSKTEYEEEKVENPIIKAGSSFWCLSGMHHIDPHKIDENKWVACVDGHNIITKFHN